MTTAHITTARIAGRIIGTTARHLIALERQIDWAEVGAIVLHGLQVLIVMTLLAGRYTRRAWDALPVLSERLGKAHSRWLVGATPAATPEPQAVPTAQPVNLVVLLSMDGWSQRRIAKHLGISRHQVKQQLAAA